MKQHDGEYGSFLFAVIEQLEDKREVPQLFEHFFLLILNTIAAQKFEVIRHSSLLTSQPLTSFFLYIQ
jgi:hypothetical protein